MRLICVLIINSLLLCDCTFGQISPGDINPAPLNKPFNFDQNIVLSRQDGSLFPQELPDVDGTPYLFKEFKLGIIVTKDRKAYDSALIRLELVNHEVQFITRANEKIVLQLGFAVEVLFPKRYDVTSSDEIFRCGYPAVDNNKVSDYYQVLSDGKLQLLKFLKKNFRQTKDEISGEIKKEFIENEFYFVFANNEITRLKRTREATIELMKDQEKVIFKWLETRKINFRKVEDLTLLFDFYNSLSK